MSDTTKKNGHEHAEDFWRMPPKRDAEPIDVVGWISTMMAPNAPAQWLLPKHVLVEVFRRCALAEAAAGACAAYMNALARMWAGSTLETQGPMTHADLDAKAEAAIQALEEWKPGSALAVVDDVHTEDVKRRAGEALKRRSAAVREMVEGMSDEDFAAFAEAVEGRKG